MTDAVGERPLLRSEHDYAWEYDGEPEGEGALRWKVLVSSGRTETSGLSMGVLEIPPGTCLEPHHHHPQEFYYVTEGHAEAYVQGRWTAVKQGDVIYWPGDFPHGIRNRGDGGCRVVWMFPTDSYDEIEYIDLLNESPGEEQPAKRRADPARRFRQLWVGFASGARRRR